MALTLRSQLPQARRIVVKVGSSSISGHNVSQIDPLVDSLAHVHARGVDVVLVSSGAIATGMPILKLDTRPEDLATQQAAASVGQSLLIYRYQRSLDRYGITAGQILLTAGDLDNETPRSNAQRALERLLGLRILPIVNENDTVATHEIRFGDNDRLSSLVAQLLRADALILLSDVDALYTRAPHLPGAERVSQIAVAEDLSRIEVGPPGSAGVGSGGASTKISAARLASTSGTAALITATPLLAHAFDGEDVGTWFPAG